MDIYYKKSFGGYVTFYHADHNLENEQIDCDSFDEFKDKIQKKFKDDTLVFFKLSGGF